MCAFDDGFAHCARTGLLSGVPLNTKQKRSYADYNRHCKTRSGEQSRAAARHRTADIFTRREHPVTLVSLTPVTHLKRSAVFAERTNRKYRSRCGRDVKTLATIVSGCGGN
jgi:hypothetical protein